jgi:hypothetical protein
MARSRKNDPRPVGGYGPETYHDKARWALHKAKSGAKAAMDNARDGKCWEAVSSIVRASMAQGEAGAYLHENSRGGENPRPQPDIRTNLPASLDRVYRACFLTKK